MSNSKHALKPTTRTRASASADERVALAAGIHASKLVQRKLPVVSAPRAQVACLQCALCCNYVAVEVDAPNTLKGATDILWYLYHRNISAYVDGDEWVIQFETRCQHLQDDNRCGIYATRPPVCREFDARSCEVNADEVGLALCTPVEFLAYLERHHKRIHTLVRKRYWPVGEPLPVLPAARRTRLGGSGPRYDALRAAGSPS